MVKRFVFMINDEHVLHFAAQKFNLPGRSQMLLGKSVLIGDRGHNHSKHGKQAQSRTCCLEQLLAYHWQ